MIKVYYSEGKNKDIDSLHLKLRDKNNHVFIQNYLRLTPRTFDEISSIEIETISGCNNSCSFCPININNDKRMKIKMEENLFKKFIDELSLHDYSGYISYFSNNEPLMDNRLLSFISYGRNSLPNAYHSLFTNGILLDEETFVKLTDLLDGLSIDNYNNDLVLQPHIKKLVEKYKDINCEVNVFVCKKDNVLDSRAGNAPNRHIVEIYTGTCILPFTQLIVKPNGDLTLCCQDAFGEMSLGNLYKNSFDNILNGEKRKKILDELQKNGRKNLHPCNRCDLFGTTNYHMKPWYYERMKTAHINAVRDQFDKSGKRNIYMVGKRDEISNQIIRILKDAGIPVEYGEKDGFLLFPTYDYEYLRRMDPDASQHGRRYLIMDILYYMIRKKEKNV